MPVELTEIIRLGENPFQALVLILQYGGLIIFFPILVWMLWNAWNEWVQNIYGSKRNHVLLAIDVPRLNEQSMKAVELIIAALHGVHFNPNKKEQYWIGVSQDSFALEIVSIDGYIQYFVRCDDYNVELVKGAVYAQYPDAEIIEVEDYVDNVPQQFPNEEWDMWGTEFVLAKDDVYPIRTYESFEHNLTGVFADPIAAVLELLSRLKPGEQVWLQLIITPTGVEWRDKSIKAVDDLIGKPRTFTPTLGDRVTAVPLRALEMTHDAVFRPDTEGFASWSSGDSRNEPDPNGNFQDLTTGEKIAVEEIQKKAARLHFDTKYRFIYLAKKDVMNSYRVAGSVFGALKQFNALDLNSLKAGGKTITSAPTYLFVNRRRNRRKTKMMMGYKYRSNWSGEGSWVLSHVELATLFHFPSENVRAPLVSKSDSKKSEPPASLPLDIARGTISAGGQELPVDPAVAGRGATEPTPQGLPVAQAGVRGEGATPVVPQPSQQTAQQLNIPAPASAEVSASAPSRQYTGPEPLHSMPGLPPGVRPVDSIVHPQQSPRQPLPQQNADNQPEEQSSIGGPPTNLPM